MGRTKSASVEPGGVDEYIAKCPKEVQGKLKAIRAAIREVAAGSIETVSYFHIPGYCYEGYDYNGMFARFSFRKPDVRLHLRPPVCDVHDRARYLGIHEITYPIWSPMDLLKPDFETWVKGEIKRIKSLPK